MRKVASAVAYVLQAVIGMSQEDTAMLMLLLAVWIAAPLILGQLLIYQRYRCVLPRVMPMDEDASYAPELFRLYVSAQERELSPLGYHLSGCTAETTGSGHLRYSAAFERCGHVNFILASVAFGTDRYRAPRKVIYTERAVVDRIQEGIWVVTNDVHLVRPGSHRVERMSAGHVSAEALLRTHDKRVGARARRPGAGLARGGHFAALLQESVETQEIYDALARRDLMQDEETGEIRPTWIGAMLISWRHFGVMAWVQSVVKRLDLHRPADEVILPDQPALAHGDE